MIDQAQGLRALARAENATQRLRSVALEEHFTKNAKGCTALAVTSGKGGVGKTNISINLALILSSLGRRVVLFDADLGLANINILMGINPRHTLSDVVEGRACLRDVLVEGPGRILLVPGGNGLEQMADLDAIALGKILRELETIEEMCDFLIFDTGAGIGKVVKAFVGSADRQLIILTPDPSSLADGYAAVKMAINSGSSRVEIIVNRVQSHEEGIAVFQRLEALCLRFLRGKPVFLGSLPFDRNLEQSVLRQRPVFLSAPQAPFSRALVRAAKKLAGYPAAPERGFFQKFFAFL